jgi:aminoglycoside/choline kinase family phosphotransferase
MILRDFHAENLIWLPDRHGAARAGLLDFQLAQMGHPVYDLVSLVQDARRDVAPATRQALIRQFCDGAGLTQADCDRALAIWGAQRALRILGVFARLAGVQGKTGYLSLLPRVWGHLQHNLLHPDLAALRRLVDAHLPAPDAGLQARLAAPSAAPSAASSAAPSGALA